ncbi:hypothetical protein [Desulfobacter hydrogenophilus]|uniref:hypothetical protein n=1 Tax=Desulfobacter hydrogenophilus TaxID=2291 RepID=UPI0013D2B960|nr:hypothetical protein [Desulfobacter hydrogenophilus]NDY71149.1 hypothetical protein [Desulfobacter hydrogenophilus]
MGITIDEVDSSIAMPDDNDRSPEETPQGEPSQESNESEHKLIETIRRIEYRRVRLMAD